MGLPRGRLPEIEKPGLFSQINCCVISTPPKIPLKYQLKNSDKDFIPYLQISLGSSYESGSHIILCADLNYIDDKNLSLTIEKIQRLQKRILSFIKYLKGDLYP
ncbi:four helix bundle protein [Zhouia spongiae]|uniref:four helix bundle protein n=1 Tax=Zhouia spongiae TaxID=2202721 RepID=UPI003BFA72AF